jgi:hypothetical protein
MNTAKASKVPAKQAETPSSASTGIIGSWVNFWFTPADPIGLHALRALSGLLFLYWLLPFAAEHQAFFGLGGWFDATAYREASRLPELPPHLFGWSVSYLCGSNPVALGAVYWGSIAAIVLFTLGIWTRLTGVLTWVAVVSYTGNPALAYDADPLLVMLAFYLMFGYLFLGMRTPHQSLMTRILGPRETQLFRRTAAPPVPSMAANLALRLFQVHFAIAMVASGLYKLQIKEWWSGLAVWFYIHPPFHTTLEEVQSYAPSAASYLVLFSLASYLALTWQIAFPAFAWRQTWRPILLGGAAVAWLACVFFVPLPLFGPIMVVACLGYLTPMEWRRLQTLAARVPGARRLVARLAAAPSAAALAGPKGGVAAKPSVVSLGQHA